jgi:hypothetical protein
MLIESDLDEIGSSSIDKDSTLGIVGKLEKFLTEVISKGIYRSALE